MELRDFLLALRKGWLLIIIATLLGGGVGALLYSTTPKSYLTTLDFYVSTPSSEGSNPQAAGQFAEGRVNSYIILLSSEQLAQRVASASGGKLTTAEVVGKISASAELNTVVVNTSVTDGDRDRSLRIARGVADAFPKMVDELDNLGRTSPVVVVHVVSGPTLKSGPVAPRSSLYLGGGLAAGLLLGLVIAVLRRASQGSTTPAPVARDAVDAGRQPERWGW